MTIAMPSYCARMSRRKLIHPVPFPGGIAGVIVALRATA